jgi:seryl-tRNA(Sec) selenium transferase
MEHGRPSKLTEEFLQVVDKILMDNINSIILTDEELFELINMNLDKEKQICYATFKNYKASNNREENEMYMRFLALYKKALTIQKKSLFDSLKNDTQAWQRYAWIIERKFSSWNLKNIQEINSKVVHTISEE